MYSKNKKHISPAIIKRLPRYLRYLGTLKAQGVERISSEELSRMMRATASQIRQDLNNFGGFGQQGYGYNVEYLYDEISIILNLHEPHSMVIIGAGNLGSAICGYRTFEKYTFSIKAMFDVDPGKIGTKIHDVEVRSMDELEEYIDANRIDVAVVTIPSESAIEVMERLEKTCIKGVWNFAHIDYVMGGDKVVESVHLSDSLMILNYMIADAKKE